MSIVSRKSVVGLGVALLATACLGVASWGFHKSDERGTNVTFATKTAFSNGTTLPAGTYRMEVPDNSQNPSVTFSKYGKVMATATAKVVPQDKKNDTTEIDTVAHGQAQLVTTIRPAGWEEALRFAPSGQQGAVTR